MKRTDPDQILLDAAKSRIGSPTTHPIVRQLYDEIFRLQDAYREEYSELEQKVKEMAANRQREWQHMEDLMARGRAALKELTNMRQSDINMVAVRRAIQNLNAITLSPAVQAELDKPAPEPMFRADLIDAAKVRCGNCQHFFSTQTAGIGHCRRFPPVSADYERAMVTHAAFPPVDSDDSCGEFTSKSEFFTHPLAPKPFHISHPTRPYPFTYRQIREMRADLRVLEDKLNSPITLSYNTRVIEDKWNLPLSEIKKIVNLAEEHDG